jgi:uncharacterized protein (UPF0147 family)
MKPVDCIGIVLAALINDTNIPVAHRVLIYNHTIQLSHLQGGRVSLVVEA